MALATHDSIYEHVILSSQQPNCAPLKPLPPNSLSQLGPLNTSCRKEETQTTLNGPGPSSALLSYPSYNGPACQTL